MREKAFYRLSELAAMAGCSEEDVLDYFDTYLAYPSVSLHSVPPAERRYEWVDGIDRTHMRNGATVQVPTFDGLYELHIDAIRALQRDGQCEVTRVFADSGMCAVTLRNALTLNRSSLFVKHREAQKFRAYLARNVAESPIPAITDGDLVTKDLPRGEKGDRALLASFVAHGGQVTRTSTGELSLKPDKGATRGALKRTCEQWGITDDKGASKRIKAAYRAQSGAGPTEAMARSLTARK